MVQQESAASTASRARSRSILCGTADPDLRMARHRTQAAMAMESPVPSDQMRGFPDRHNG